MIIKINGKGDKFYKEIDGKIFEVGRPDGNGHIDIYYGKNFIWTIPEENYEILEDEQIETNEPCVELDYKEEYHTLIAQLQNKEIIINALINQIKETK